MRAYLLALMAVTLLIHENAVADTAVSATHEQAASELLNLMGAEDQMMSGAAAMIDAMPSQSPEMEQYRDVILEWAESVLTWEVL